MHRPYLLYESMDECMGSHHGPATEELRQESAPCADNFRMIDD